ncbi:hypothetical protein POM88_024126 [Heracleum sosnowskyi]|uniref:Uncharacterized protein n=1 Tax=Heracleum sosnowskyi TaxID=360622 RepID=A0AAD8IIW9_9APIA|nr:hypothetical protein POM88_024126 [Heracleum sosnowskyi]
MPDASFGLIISVGIFFGAVDEASRYVLDHYLLIEKDRRDKEDESKEVLLREWLRNCGVKDLKALLTMVCKIVPSHNFCLAEASGDMVITYCCNDLKMILLISADVSEIHQILRRTPEFLVDAFFGIFLVLLLMMIQGFPLREVTNEDLCGNLNLIFIIMLACFSVGIYYWCRINQFISAIWERDEKGGRVWIFICLVKLKPLAKFLENTSIENLWLCTNLVNVQQPASEVIIENGTSLTATSSGATFRARFVGQGYKQICGQADVWGDGVVPEVSAHLEGALNISLDGVYHSPVGSDDESRPWYGRWTKASIPISRYINVTYSLGFIKVKLHGLVPLQRMQKHLILLSQNFRLFVLQFVKYLLYFLEMLHTRMDVIFSDDSFAAIGCLHVRLVFKVPTFSPKACATTTAQGSGKAVRRYIIVNIRNPSTK